MMKVLKDIHKEKGFLRWIIGLAFIAVCSLIGWGYSSIKSYGDSYAESAVRKDNVNKDIIQLKCNDTIQVKDIKTIVLKIDEFIQEVRHDRRKDILIDNLQNQKIDKLADKMMMRQELDDMQKNLDNLQQQIDRQSYKIFINKNMLLPGDYDSTFGQPFVKSTPCKTN